MNVHSQKEQISHVDSGRIILSVVCAVFNGSKVIGDLLQSYAKQDRKNTELIVIDGASSDRTVEIVRASGVANLVLSEPDCGIYDAWNKAIRHCSGTHVAFIGADDLLADGSLQHIVEACQCASGSVNIIAGFNILTRNRIPVQLLGEVFDTSKLLRRMPMAHVMSAHSLNWLRELGGFDASFRSAGDYELLLRSSKALSVQTIPYILAYMEDGGTSRSALLPHFETWRARRKNEVSTVLAGGLLMRALGGSLLREIGLKR
ncbi:glycosyltransferase [Pandoraea sp.]|uniref:glycosyltransferase n=1 Tax=Pandoraea sp. TaxID=1883445 RepID=UPI0035AD867A